MGEPRERRNGHPRLWGLRSGGSDGELHVEPVGSEVALGQPGVGAGAAVASPMTEWSSRERPRLETQTVGVVRV